MSSGFIAFARGLQVYHWQMTVNLAWFSAITHFATLTCLRKELSQTPAKKASRLVLMFCLVVMLIIGHYFTRDYSFEENIEHPKLQAICYLLVERNDEPYDLYHEYSTHYADVMLSILALVYGFIIRVLKLYPRTSRVDKVLKKLHKPRDWAGTFNKLCQPRWLGSVPIFQLLWYMLVAKPLLVLALVLKLHVDFALSTISEVSHSIETLITKHFWSLQPTTRHSDKYR